MPSPHAEGPSVVPVDSVVLVSLPAATHCPATHSAPSTQPPLGSHGQPTIGAGQASVSSVVVVGSLDVAVAVVVVVGTIVVVPVLPESPSPELSSLHATNASSAIPNRIVERWARAVAQWNRRKAKMRLLCRTAPRSAKLVP
jgi:hypothetical protein